MSGQLKKALRSVKFDWKRLVFPIVIDSEKQTEEEQKQNGYYNRSFAVIYGVILIVSMIIAYPNFKIMLALAIVIILGYFTFCSVMNSIHFKNKGGRKSMTTAKSFKELFDDEERFKKIDQYIRSKASQHKMDSRTAYCVLMAIIEEKYVKGEMEQICVLFITAYGKLLSFETTRSITRHLESEEKEKIDVIRKEIAHFSSINSVSNSLK